MNDKIVEFISDLDSTSFDEFMTNATIDSVCELEDDLNYDYSWLNPVEQNLPFLLNIVNMNYTTADINVVISYENRFIKTLICRLRDFLSLEQNRFLKMTAKVHEKKFKAEITTKLPNEDVMIAISVKSTKTESSTKGESYGLSLQERIERLINITDNMFNSDFMKKLSNTSLIQEPIEKTTLFEEEANYRKVLELYNYLENYMLKDNEYDVSMAKKKIEDKLLVTSYLEYQLLNDCLAKKKDGNAYRIFLDRLIEKMVLDSTMDEKNFKRMLTKKFEDEYTKKKNREKNIQNLFLKQIDEYNKQVKDALRALKN